MTAQKIIAFDLDGVLVDLIPGLCKMCERLTGLSVSPEEWIAYDYFIRLGISYEEFVHGHVTDNVLETAILYSGVTEIIATLQQRGFKIAIITARGSHPEGEAITRATLHTAGITVDHLLLVAMDETKVMAMKALQQHGVVVGYIDDYPEHLHALQAATPEIELFLMDRPWNKQDTTFSRLSSVEHFAQLINNLNLPGAPK